MSNPTQRKLVLLILAIALLAGSFILSAPRTAAALPGSSCFCTYYSDSTYSTEVGERDVYCNGHTFRWGTTSPYVICDCEPC
jgi:hypothetical protein